MVLHKILSYLCVTVIRDWHLEESGDSWESPNELRDNYRFVIEQSTNTKQVYFKVYPKSVDELSTEITLNGLSGVIEIRSGKPYFRCQ